MTLADDARQLGAASRDLGAALLRAGAHRPLLWTARQVGRLVGWLAR